MYNYKQKEHAFYSFFILLIKLTRGVCRGLPCYAVSPERLFSFLGKTTMALSD